MTPEDKQKQLHLSLDDKIKRSKELILEWYFQFDGKVYVSFSGGKDSTVLLHLARTTKYCENIPAVFCDTGLEYPEVREHVKSVDNVIWIKPKLTFKQVIEKYGWPIVSKEQARYIYEFRHSKSEYVRNLKLNGTGKNGRSGKISQCWRPLVNADFEITSACCDVMKKRPMKNFEKETGLHPIVGTMAVESRRRFEQYMRGNCNAFSASHPISKPLSFWTEQDILEYIKRYNIKIPSVYGNIVQSAEGLKTTGCNRTGCMFCMFGLHLKKNPNRFERMKETHPKQYDYIMNKLNGKHVMDVYLSCSPLKSTRKIRTDLFDV